MKSVLLIGVFLFTLFGGNWAQSDSVLSTPEVIAVDNSDVGEIQSGINWKDYIGIGALVAILVWLIGVYFKKSVDATINAEMASIQRRLNEFEENAKKKTQEVIITTLNTNELVLKKLVELVDLENKLIKTKRIKIAGEMPDDIFTMLKQVGFQERNLGKPEDELEDFQIYFINNNAGTLDLKVEVEKVKILPAEVHVFYYCTKGLFFPMSDLPEEMRHRINFATNPAQIFGNLINTLKYQDRLSRS